MSPVSARSSGRSGHEPGRLAAPVASPRPPWPVLAVGGAVMGYAIVGAWRDLGGDFRGWALWIVGADLAHDAIVAPLACLLGALVARVVPAGRARAHVQAGLVGSAAMLAVTWIPLRGWGGNPANTTIRPLDYTSATLTALALVWTVAAVSAAVATVRSRRIRSGRIAP